MLKRAALLRVMLMCECSLLCNYHLMPSNSVLPLPAHIFVSVVFLAGRAACDVYEHTSLAVRQVALNHFCSFICSAPYYARSMWAFETGIFHLSPPSVMLCINSTTQQNDVALIIRFLRHITLQTSSAFLSIPRSNMLLSLPPLLPASFCPLRVSLCG